MNQVPEEQKESVTKSLAIVGFVFIVLFIVWLAVQIVSIIPSAFSSLASIASGVYGTQNNKELAVATKSSVINAGESFTVSWTKMRGNGSYSFSYECTEGVAVDIRKGSGGITAVACDTELPLGNTLSIDVLATSEKQRFTDVLYTITYSNENIDGDIKNDSVITIVNASIPTITEITLENEESEKKESSEEKEIVDNPVIPTTPVYRGPVTIKEITYSKPVSDPNGTIDLNVTHIGVGTLTGNTFIPTATIDTDKKGAIRFEIKNVGTKTASNWSYEATLPSGIIYKSGDQKALKPNERALITLGFEGISRTGVEKFGAEVTAKGDVKKSNNKYTWSVEVVD